MRQLKMKRPKTKRPKQKSKTEKSSLQNSKKGYNGSMKNNKDVVLFYTEYQRDGHQHYSVNRYNRVTGIVEYPSDHIFTKEA